MAYDDPRDLRDEGMHRALEKTRNGRQKALPHVIAIPKGWEGLWEEVRISCTNRGVKQPHVPQVWSAFCNACLKMELLSASTTGVSRDRAPVMPAPIGS